MLHKLIDGFGQVLALWGVVSSAALAFANAVPAEVVPPAAVGATAWIVWMVCQLIRWWVQTHYENLESIRKHELDRLELTVRLEQLRGTGGHS